MIAQKQIYYLVKLTPIVVLLFIFQQFGSAQNLMVLKGQIVADSTNEPIPYATIYIDGTTNGTISNVNGEFILSDISNSSIIVISHVSYYPKTIEINSDTLLEIRISLQERNLELVEVNIEDKNLRNKNLDLFKWMFIGRDYWGENAQLLNDSVLRFTTQYNSEKREVNEATKKEIRLGKVTSIYEWSEDSTYITIKELTKLEVNALAPLDIDMPLLAYKLKVDLIDFSLDIDNGYVRSNFLGHYYFHPNEIKNRREEKRIERNRRLTYFNSGKHFLRSLYDQELDENGFKLDEILNEDTTTSSTNTIINFKTHVNYIDNDRLQFIGLKGKELIISYYSDSKHEPLDVSSRHRSILQERYTIEKSKLYFLKDTCTINNLGIIPNNEIMFGGSISQKRVGSYLPQNYVLKEYR